MTLILRAVVGEALLFLLSCHLEATNLPQGGLEVLMKEAGGGALALKSLQIEYMYMYMKTQVA